MSDTENTHSIQLKGKVITRNLTDSDSDEEQLEVFTSRLNGVSMLKYFNFHCFIIFYSLAP